MPAKRALRSSRRAEPSGLDPDLVEDVDAFMDGRSEIALSGARRVAGDDDDDQEGIEAIGLGSEDGEDSDDDEDYDSEEEEGPLRLEEEEEDEDEQLEEGWGKRKADYYDADEAEGSEEEREEAAEAERTLARRAARLRAEDFGEDEVAASSDEDPSAYEVASILGRGRTTASGVAAGGKAEAKKSRGSKAAGGAAMGAAAMAIEEELEALDGNHAVERLERDLAGMSERERQALLELDAPELPALARDFSEFLGEVKGRLLPARQRLRRLGPRAPPDGVQFVRVRARLLLSYCAHVALYLLLKVERRAAKSHPVIDKLVALRALIQRLAPAQQAMEEQLDALLAGPNEAPFDVGELVLPSDRRTRAVTSAAAASDVPRLSSASDTRHGDGGSSGAGKQAKKGAKKRDAGMGTGRGALRANARVAAEYLEKDEFLDENWGLALCGDSVDDGDSQSEDGVGGRPGSRSIAGRKRPLRTLRTLESADDLGDRDEALDAEEDDKALAYAKKRSTRDYVESREQARKAARAAEAVRGGEADVPVRDRRALIQQVEHRKRMAAHAAAIRGKSGDHIDAAEEKSHDAPATQHKSEAGHGKGLRATHATREETGEDPLYVAVREAKSRADAARRDKYAFARPEYRPDETVGDGGKREAGRVIEKNRGLVPHRSKDKKNPRVKHRLKYEKHKIKERTSFYGRQTRTDQGAYAGEATGIKANVSRSRKL